MDKVLLVTALILAGCVNDNLPTIKSNSADSTAAAIIGGYEESSEKVSAFVYRYKVVADRYCTSAQMQNGLILTANHCLIYNGAARELGSFSRNNPGDFVGAGTMFSFTNQATEETIFADDIAAAVLTEAKTPPHQGFLYPTTPDLPEKLFIAGYGYDSFGAFSNNAKSIPLRGLALSKSKQLLKDLSQKEIGFEIRTTPEATQKLLFAMDVLVRSGKLFCFKPTSTTTDSANQGDSGGPLYSLDENGTPVLRGIFSTIIGPDDHTLFFCYTNVIPYIEWAQGIAQNGEDLTFKNKIYVKTPTRSLSFDSQILGGISLTPRSVSGPLVDISLGREQDTKGIDLNGKIALVRRGDIPFSTKITNATAAGAVGVILYNNDPASEQALVNKSLEYHRQSDIKNPLDARMISYGDGQILVEILKSGEQIETTLSIP